MRKLITTTFMSLDGIVQGPGGPEEDTSNGFTRGGWSVPYWDDAIGEFMGEAMGKPFDLVLGRKTYDIFAGYWPHHDAEGAELNRATKYVASRSTQDLKWQNSRQLEGDVVEAVKALKNGEGPELQVHGSANLIQSLLPAGVIDEMRVITYPVVVANNGKRLFEPDAPALSLKVIKSTVADNGVVLSVFKPSVGIDTATFG